MSRAVITGGAGFIGSHLAKHLVGEGWEVAIVDDFSTGSMANVPNGVELVECNVISPMWMIQTGMADVIWHLASPCSPPDYQSRRLETLQTNGDGTLVALAAAKQSDATFVLASTSEVYGDPTLHPQPEHYWGNVDPVGPRSCYDEGKRYAEALTMAAAHEHGTEVHIARIFNTYGPGMPDDGRVMVRFITAALKGDPLVIQGNGYKTRSFCYVDDLIDGLLMLADSDEQVCNLGLDHEVTIKALAETVIRVTDSSSEIHHVESAPGDPSRRCPNLDVAKLIGFEPTVELEEGIRRTAEAIQNG